MVRVSYEGMLVLILEGLGRNAFYFYESNLCTIPTEHTISTLVQKDINQANLYRKHNTALKKMALCLQTEGNLITRDMGAKGC